MFYSVFLLGAFVAQGICAQSNNQNDLNVDFVKPAENGRSSGVLFESSIGLGASRLKKFKGHNPVQELTSDPAVQQFWFKNAIVDNFASLNNQQEWFGNGQRYWVNDQFYGGEGSPLLVFIGGEGAESASRLTSRMYFYQIAQEYKCAMVDLEHRFYGESYPTEDMSTENLNYLSSEQALADLNRFISYFKSLRGWESSPVITIGGSYPGNLAAWFRTRYPSTTIGSWASSAPLHSVTDFDEYMEVVGEAMVYYSGQKCFDAVESAATQFQVISDSGSSGWDQLSADFKTCKPLASMDDLVTLESMLGGNIQGTVQYNREHYGVMNVTDVCAIMEAGTIDQQSAYEAFIDLNDAYLTQAGLTCTDASYADMMAYLGTSTFDGSSNYRQWTWQTCNEFGYFQSTSSVNQPFIPWAGGLNLAYYEQMCLELFQISTPPQVEYMNDVYGSLKIDGTNIMLIGGTIDPWHALGFEDGVKLQNADDLVGWYMEGTAHCNDLYAAASSDVKDLTATRKKISNMIGKWLKEYYHAQEEEDL